MAQFDENKVISPLHPEKAEVGKRYWISDKLIDLKDMVEIEGAVFKLTAIIGNSDFPFVIDSPEGTAFQFLYPYEEPPKKRMTNIQLMEWISKRNGMFKYAMRGGFYYISKACPVEKLNDEVDKAIIIRSWDSDEWVEPTTDIYERDCKKED